MSTTETFIRPKMFIFYTVGLVDMRRLDAISYAATMSDGADSLYSAFGKLVQAHRRRIKGMTQEELGRRIGLSRTSVTNIEQGRHHVSLHHLFRIANALQIPPEVLLPPQPEELSGSRMAALLPPDTERELVEWADRL